MSSDDIELAQTIQTPTNSYATTHRKAHPRQAMLVITGWPNFSSRGAAYHLNPGKQAVHFRSQRIEIIFAGAKKDH